MRPASLELLVVALTIVTVSHLVYSVRYRAWVLAFGNMLTVGLLVRGAAERALLAGVVLSGYAMLSAMQRGLVRTRALVAAYGAVLVGVLWVVRANQFTDASSQTAQHLPLMPVVGLSYLLFRIGHMLIDAAQGALAPVRFLDYVNYTCAFYTFVAGPIQRWGEYHAHAMAETDRARVDVRAGLDRMVDGCLKALVLAPLVAPFADVAYVLGGEAPSSLLVRFAIWWYAWYVFLYLDFSGFIDIMAGLSILVGKPVPENFNRPWLARNLVEFWQRWHITLSQWLRDYVFAPVCLTLARAGLGGGWITLSLAYFVTFAVAGIWHGPTVSFMRFGVLHGLGLVAVQLGTVVLARLPSTWRARYRESWLVRAGAIGLCQTYVAFTILVFAHRPDDLAAVMTAVKEVLS
ncbi:MAG: hypothetical protein EB084_17040 [Proteobacteria bacterium]|nr:hypothetical protein [Pseudomonadota bacterium]